MIKIMLTVRNRLEITKKCIESLQKNTKLDYHLYVYNNLTSYRLNEHFEYFCKLFKQGIIKQLTFNSKESTFNAFSKAVSSNSFGHLHNDDPNKNKYDFLVMLDNDILLQNGWDYIILRAWEEVINHNLTNIKVICQHPGGLVDAEKLPFQIAGYDAIIGKFGGSFFWTISPKFFEEVEFLDISQLVGLTKKHDQNLWPRIQKAANSDKYILSLKAKMGLNAGSIVGSICNVIGYGNQSAINLEKIKYKETDKMIQNMTIDELYSKIEKSGVKMG